MIVSASYRTDIPALYSAWFRERFAAGHASVASPYGGPSYRVALRQGVEGYVFWTRNAAPFLSVLHEIRAAGLPFVLQYTVTGYPRAVERAVPEPGRAIALMRRLSETYGPLAVVWRYDPILVSALTPPDWHLRNFAALARALAGATTEAVTSFVQPYRKTARRLAASGIAWRDPAPADKREMLTAMAGIAGASGMALTLCTQPALDVPGVGHAACIDARRLSLLAGRAIAAPMKGNRPGCRCAQARDIGAYDSCTQGCAYCYAVRSEAIAKRTLRRHSPHGEGLISAPPRLPALAGPAKSPRSDERDR